ncbi:HD superfamily phosphohydrolase [Spiroplasma gladiatoris]|uniref:HD superfamily phosphohydrolase n=1 Tax=Spiroplasma gladiatoris TaxID=2143 RepID=A0A4P7AI96_9MOLU|nr:HD domain-containing protein [Spiroplasma gladiatoris]QBQ08194.1 HD superfamily phosphohydrolase [Spiroplasma gladiatoris]
MEYIRDNVHGDIKIKDEVIKELINTKEFQRLRRIIQLGGGQFVFPGANHTRFSHSIGVYHVIGKFLNNVHIGKQITNNDKLLVQIAGLLHDLGHGPFSHTFEKISTVQPHEKYTADIILGKTEVNAVLKKHGLNPENVVAIIEGTYKNSLLNSFVSSQLDADRLDYLLRDSINTGVSYSKLDLDWIIRNARIINNKLVFRLKALYAVENYLLGRFYMFKQIYHHNVSFRFDYTLKSWFMRLTDLYNNNYEFKNKDVINSLKDLLEGKKCNLEDYLRLDDYTMIEWIKKTQFEEDEILRDFANRIINRKFLKVANSIESKQLNLYKDLVDKINQKYYFTTIENIDLIIYDCDKNNKILFCRDEDKNIFELSELSEILKSVPRNIEKILYVFIKDNVK